MTECTNMECSGEAEFAYWMPDLGHFSKVRSPELDQLEDGDLSPYVCESCKERMASSPQWDEDQFVRPKEKLVTDGGQEATEDSRFRDREKALEAARQSGKTERKIVVCPQCGGEFQNLPHHLPCSGKEGSA